MISILQWIGLGFVILLCVALAGALIRFVWKTRDLK
jgi:hypothetical protein